MIDLDELERLIKASKQPAQPVSGATALALIAEVRALREDLQATKLLAHANAEMFKAEQEEARRLREELATPLLTGADAPMYGGIFAAEGISHDAAHSAFYSGAQTVTVYFGRRHVYTCLADFYTDYPKAPK